MFLVYSPCRRLAGGFGASLLRPPLRLGWPRPVAWRSLVPLPLGSPSPRRSASLSRGPRFRPRQGLRSLAPLSLRSLHLGRVPPAAGDSVRRPIISSFAFLPSLSLLGSSLSSPFGRSALLGALSLPSCFACLRPASGSSAALGRARFWGRGGFRLLPLSRKSIDFRSVAAPGATSFSPRLHKVGRSRPCPHLVTLSLEALRVHKRQLVGLGTVPVRPQFNVATNTELYPPPHHPNHQAHLHL